MNYIEDTFGKFSKFVDISIVIKNTHFLEIGEIFNC